MDFDCIKKIRLYLVAMFFIVAIFSLFLIRFNCVALYMPFFILETAYESHMVLLVFVFSLIIILASLFVLGIPVIYPFTAIAIYKLIKNEPITKFQKACLRIFPWLLVPVIIELLVIVAWGIFVAVKTLLNI